MNRQQFEQSLRQFGQKLGKFKFPIFIFLLGLVLLAIPTRKKPAQPPAAEPAMTAASDALRTTEDKMEQILSRIEGAGRVRVMLEYAAGEKNIYQTDSSQEVSTDPEGKQTKTESKTVLASGTGTGGTPVAVQTLRPTYRGALIVSDGADSASVRWNLVNAVSGLTGLGTDKITVAKMKSE